MADFCLQCSLANFGEDFQDLANLSTPANTQQQFFAVVICEGCGLTSVDHTGQCVFTKCLENHNVTIQPT